MRILTLPTLTSSIQAMILDHGAVPKQPGPQQYYIKLLLLRKSDKDTDNITGKKLTVQFQLPGCTRSGKIT